MSITSYAQNFEDVMLWRALKDVRQGFYIDVGAFDPDWDSVTRAFYEAGWRGMNIEPMAAGHRRLVQRRARDINLHLAVGDREGVMPLHTIPETGLSTLDPAQAAVHEQAGLVLQREEVRVTTLAALCALHAPAAIHFLKVDCEGSERAALAGADFGRFRPWIVVVEATAPNTQDPSHAEWEPILLAADYVFVWFDGLNRFYVAAEQHAALGPAFSAPPNVFDRFTLPGQMPAVLPRRVAAGSLEATTPPMVGEEARIAITARCRDADPVPKVSDAGAVRPGPDGTLVQVMHNGLLVPAGAYYGDWMMRLITLCRGHHEPQEERLFHEVVSRLPDGATMLELGGYWAYYTAWFLSGGAGRRAVVLEPDPVHRAAGEQTLALNGLHAAFEAGFAGAAPAVAAPFRTEKSGTLPLPRVSVPELMARHGMERLDLLHCDTQGAELDVLTGCRDLLQAGRIGWVFVSTHAHPITGDPLTHQRCLALLRDLGGVIEGEHDVYESFSGDGLIVARFGPAPEGWVPVPLSRNRYGESLYRNPAFDLAEALAPGADGPVMARFVDAVYRALLLRPADGDGLRVHAGDLVETGDMQGFLEKVLTCGEFADNLDRFGGAYGFRLPSPAPASARPASGPALGAAEALPGGGTRFVLQHDGPLGRQGEAVALPSDGVIGPHVQQTGAWNAAHVAFVAERLGAGESYTLLDVGANVGLFSRQLLHACPEVRTCICVEPDEGNFALLKQNLAGFAGRTVRLHNLALDRADGEARFWRDRENSGNYSLNADAMRGRPHEAVTVRTAAAAGWMARHAGGTGPLIWKSDAQGHDPVIIGETPWAVWNRVAVAVIELWRLKGVDQDVQGFLERIDGFAHKTIGLDRAVTTAEVAAYLSGDDWAHDDLFLWR